MSISEHRIPLDKGHQIMASLLPLLDVGAHRVAGVGSWIRRRETLGDLEVLAVPRIVRVDLGADANSQGGLLGGGGQDVNGVWLALQRLVDQDRAVPIRPAVAFRPDTGVLPVDEAWHARRLADTARKLRVWLPPCQALVEIYLCPAEEWGVQETFRVGPEEFSKAVAHAKRLGRPIRRGRVWCGGEAIPTPEPEDVFRALNLRWVPRPLRRDGRDLREL